MILNDFSFVFSHLPSVLIAVELFDALVASKGEPVVIRNGISESVSSLVKQNILTPDLDSPQSTIAFKKIVYVAAWSLFKAEFSELVQSVMKSAQEAVEIRQRPNRLAIQAGEDAAKAAAESAKTATLKTLLAAAELAAAEQDRKVKAEAAEQDRKAKEAAEQDRKAKIEAAEQDRKFKAVVADLDIQIKMEQLKQLRQQPVRAPSVHRKTKNRTRKTDATKREPPADREPPIL